MNRKLFPAGLFPLDEGTSALSLFVILFCIYLFSLAPSIYTGDSALFAAASYSLGSAHPPGYPLFVLLGKLFTFLPFGNVAFRVNLLSAVAGALTCVVTYKASVEFTGSRASAWASAFMAGLVPAFFIEAVKAEVYTLNAFLCMTVFYLGLRVLRGAALVPNTLAALFLIGLGMGNHQTIGFMGIVLLWPLAMRWRELSLRWLVWAPLALISGFSVNLLLYIRSLVMLDKGVLLVYSFVGNWKEFIDVFFRKLYKSGDTLTALSHSFRGVSPWLRGVGNSVLHVGLPAVMPLLPIFLIGLLAIAKQKRLLIYFGIFFAVWFVFLARISMGASSLSMDAFETVRPYFLPVFPVLFCITAAGFSSVLGFLRKTSLSLLPRFAPVIVVMLPFVILPFTVRDNSLSGSFIAYDFGRDMLTALPAKSMLLNYSDNSIFATFYMRAVERQREDILVMQTAGKKDTYGLESSPYWKYAALYPDFFLTKKTSVSSITRDFASEGRLFVSSPEHMTENVARRYSYYPYLLTSALYDRRDGGAKEQLSQAFKQNFDKLDYERVLHDLSRPEIITEELFSRYGFCSMVYGDLLKRDGYEQGGEVFYKAAFNMSNPKTFLWPFMKFLLNDGRKEEAFTIMNDLKGSATYAELGKHIEAKTLSAIEGGVDN